MSFGIYGIHGFVGSLQERTKRAWLNWARWGRWELRQWQRVGVDPATVPEPGSLCPICFSSSVYVRLGVRNSWMRGICTCRACHAPVLIQRPQPPEEAQEGNEKELVLVGDREREDENVT